jgi:N-acetylmuramoyl-L-alanine amidase
MQQRLGWLAALAVTGALSAVENEGYAIDRSYFTDALYTSLAKLARCLADRHSVTVDRLHILGHDQVTGPIASYQARAASSTRAAAC